MILPHMRWYQPRRVLNQTQLGCKLPQKVCSEQVATSSHQNDDSSGGVAGFGNEVEGMGRYYEKILDSMGITSKTW